MKKTIIISIKAILLFTLVLGVIYPLTVYGIGQIFFPHQANGSLIKQDNQVIGSELIGQNFDDPLYFYSRPTCEQPQSVLSQSYQALLDKRVAKMMSEHGEVEVPVELVTCSASQKDPHLSLHAIEYQIQRVAKNRQMNIAEVDALVNANTHRPWFNLLGEPYVNVLQLNQALDR